MLAGSTMSDAKDTAWPKQPVEKAIKRQRGPSAPRTDTRKPQRIAYSPTFSRVDRTEIAARWHHEHFFNGLLALLCQLA